jgi:MerR family transcriptional regulator, light-induced transcriptional regulator
MHSQIPQELLSGLSLFNRVIFEKRLNGAVAVIPFIEVLRGIMLPLQAQVGQLWHDGHLDVAIEHYITRQIRQKIFFAMNQFPVAEFGAKVVVACPPREEHDIAALEANATELVQALADEVRSASDLAVGGPGALAMPDLFMKYNVMILENFAELDHRLDRLMRQTVSLV